MSKPFVFVVVLVAFVLSFNLYNFYYNSYYDSSIDGSEIAEIQNNTIPDDVKKSLEQNQKLFPRVLSATTYRIPILMYHYVEYVEDKGDKTRMSLNTPPFILEEEIKTLAQAGYTFITNKELVDILDGKSKPPQKPVVLTFDDGYRDFYTDVFPILKKYNVKATAYLISGFLNWQNHLTDTQTQEIAQSNLVEIGAHTVHHSWLKGRSLKDITSEVTQSKTMLEEQFKISVVSFAYPFGAFDQPTIDAVKKAGFRSATSTIPGIEQNQQNKYFLYRLRPGGRTGDVLLKCLDQKTFTAF